MSRPGVIVWSLTPDTHLVIVTPDVDTGLVHARRTASGLGFRSFPNRVTTIVLETHDTNEVTTGILSARTHEQVISWVQRNEVGDVGVVLSANESSDELGTGSTVVEHIVPTTDTA